MFEVEGNSEVEIKHGDYTYNYNFQILIFPHITTELYDHSLISYFLLG